MGLIFSKYEETNKQPIEIILETEQEDTIKSAPISTPNRLDPRSPSTAIARTPLELILSQKPNLNQTPINNNNSGQRIVFGVDPRSPATEFQRTPIVIVDNDTGKEKYAKLYNKNLENVRKLLINDEIITKPSTNCNKRKSIVGVLETNIDFTETNIDDVLQQKLNESLPKETEKDCIIVESTTNQDEIEKQQEISDNDDNDECVGIDMAAHFKDFDKKLSTLIYEDKTSDSEEKIVEKLPKIRENNRTPLSVRNMNREPEKKLSKLKVSDKPTRNSRIPVFKDAHYRNGVQCENTPPPLTTTTTTIFNGDGIKPKVSKWDGDSTLFI